MSVLDAVVLADDLTGAADAGLAFAAAGLSTDVALGDDLAPGAAQVLAVDADTRRLTAGEAAARVTRLATSIGDRSVRLVYKMLDSTLRGHVGAELSALLLRARRSAQGGRALLLVAPAFPATGRVTRGGAVFVNGVPLEASEEWRDAGEEGRSTLVDMLAERGVRATVARLERVRRGSAALARDLDALAADGATAVICDAELDADLAAVAGAGAQLSRPVLWAGSGGLAAQLPAALGLRPDPARRAPAPARGGGPVLVLVGSRSSVARDQAWTAAAQPGVARIDLSALALLAGERGIARALSGALRRGRDVVATVGEEPVGSELAIEVAAAAGMLVAANADLLGGLVLTGGDTARAALVAIGARRLHLAGEVEPGVPLGVLAAPRRLPVVTKAGAFGTVAALARARDAVRRLAGPLTTSGEGDPWHGPSSASP